MRSVRLFRNGNIIRVYEPIWKFCWPRHFGGSSVVKKVDQIEPDPYEGNFNFADCDQYTKVTVIGAAGRVGKTLSLLLKTCPLVDHLCLFDTDKSVKGIGVDISHVDTKCCVSYVCGMRNIHKALDGPDVVVIAAGCPTSPQLIGNKLFDKNAPIVAGLSEACARFCPKACIVLITNPINSLLPVMGEVYQIITSRIPSRKLFGLTALDVVRANTFVAEVVRKDPNNIIVPVIGGSSQDTIVPVFSHMKPYCKIKKGELIALTECLKRAEGNLADCQNCGARGSSSLSTAYAAFRFTTSLVMALKGASNIIECAYVQSDIIPELEYMASPVRLGPRGIEYNFGYPPLSDYEVSLMEQAAPALVNDIEMGKCYVVEHMKKQKKVFRRCPPKRDSFFNIYSNPSDACGEKRSIPSTICKRIKLKSKSNENSKTGKHKRFQKPNCENATFSEAVGEPGIMLIGDGRKDDFFLSSLWISGLKNSTWVDGDSAMVSENTCSERQDSESEDDTNEDDYEQEREIIRRQTISRKYLFLSALQTKDVKGAIENVDVDNDRRSQEAKNN